MKDKRILFIISLLPMLIGMYTNFIEKSEYLSGKNVFATIIEAPKNCEALNYKYAVVKLRYKNDEYVKGVNKKHCPFIGKKMIEVRVNQDEDKLFFLEGEDFNEQIIYSFAIFCIGIYIYFKLNKR